MKRRHNVTPGEDILKGHTADVPGDPLLNSQGQTPEAKNKFRAERVRQDFTALFHLSVMSTRVDFDDANKRQYKGMEGFLDPAPTGFTILQDNSFDTTGDTVAYRFQEGASSIDNTIAGRLADFSKLDWSRIPVSVDLLRAWMDNPNFFPEKYKAEPGTRYYIPGTLIMGETIRIPYITFEGGKVQCALSHMASGWEKERDRFLFFV